MENRPLETELSEMTREQLAALETTILVAKDLETLALSRVFETMNMYVTQTPSNQRFKGFNRTLHRLGKLEEHIASGAPSELEWDALMDFAQEKYKLIQRYQAAHDLVVSEIESVERE